MRQRICKPPYQRLPLEIQELANQAFTLLRDNPRHPSIRLKKIGRFFSARVGVHYRALAVEREDAIYWFWIGLHDEYQRILNAGD